jgi:mono/diheme cytochrome c family protein
MSSPRPETKRRRAVRLLAVGWILGLVTVAVGALVYIQTGWFNATAFDPHDPIMAWGTHYTMIRSVQLRAHAISAPARFTPAQVQAGFQAYDSECVMCHGAPGVPRADWTSGLTPTPPFLIDSARRWNSAQLYWIVGEGVKMTAMPAWRTTRTSADVWNLVAFLEALPDLSPADYARMWAADQAHPR